MRSIESARQLLGIGAVHGDCQFSWSFLRSLSLFHSFFSFHSLIREVCQVPGKGKRQNDPDDPAYNRCGEKSDVLPPLACRIGGFPGSRVR